MLSRFYSESSKVMAGALVLLGVAMVASTLARGGGAFTLGVILGVLFVLLGAARLRLAGVLGSSGR